MQSRTELLTEEDRARTYTTFVQTYTVEIIVLINLIIKESLSRERRVILSREACAWNPLFLI